MEDNPLIKALPPETDYLTYLTILEFNLTKEQLPTLYTLLQDTTLTTNIGWDLVHLLLPLLPESEQCLQVVARLGNPREVVLKVTELLDALGEEEDREEEDEDPEEAEVEVEEELRDYTQTLGNGVDNESAEESIRQDVSSATLTTDELMNGGVPPPIVDPKLSKFQNLLAMLSIIHPRIKTKYPSRFLCTSLQAILPAYAAVATDPAATDAVVHFIKELSGSKRPKLPPRQSSQSVPKFGKSNESAPDPEANPEVPGSEELALQTRLFQSFLSHIIEIYMENILPVHDDSPMAWTARVEEKKSPKMIVPHRQTYISRFAQTISLRERDTIVGQLIALARDLSISTREMFAVVTHAKAEPVDFSELPSSPSEIPLSHAGSLYLLAAIRASSFLFDVPPSLEFDIFPAHFNIMKHFIGDSEMGGIGIEPSCVIDSVLLLGLSAFARGHIGKMHDKEQFNEYLQRLSLLSANTPSSTLRYHAHLLTTLVLHAHPSQQIRLDFIRDTLQHCPYENLKASAVGWLKDEILQAEKCDATVDKASDLMPKTWIFLTREALESVAPFLFPKVNPADMAMEDLQLSVPFYLASLNLLYLLCHSQGLRRRFRIEDRTFVKTVAADFLDPLNEAAQSLMDAAKEEAEGRKSAVKNILAGGFSELMLLRDTIARAKSVLPPVPNLPNE